MTDYLQLLEHSYAQECADTSNKPESRLEYLAERIFGFVTYEQEMAELFAGRALLVCDAISQGKTFELIEDGLQRKWFLLMVNMPFFKDRIDWGGSIRGAWWDHDGQKLFTCGLWVGDVQQTDWEFTSDDWKAFVRAMVLFAGAQ